MRRRLRRPRHALSIDVAMADEDAMSAHLETAAELVDEHDRAMPSAGAPERDREVALPLAPVARQGEAEQIDEPPEELLRLVALEDVARDRGIGPGPVPQLLDEERVREKTTVE